MLTYSLLTIGFTSVAYALVQTEGTIAISNYKLSIAVGSALDPDPNYKGFYL